MSISINQQAATVVYEDTWGNIQQAVGMQHGAYDIFALYYGAKL